MATTQEDLQKQDAEYSAAFAEPEVEKPEVSEDEAFGLLPEQPEDGTSAPSEESQTGDEPAAAIDADRDQDNNSVETPTEKPAMTKDQQREASWEGRLRAREAELKAREDALKAMEEALKSGKPAEPAEPDGDEVAQEESPKEEATEAAQLSEVVKQVEDGDMSAEDAMKQLSSDFGPEFAKAVSALINKAAMDTASKVADERIGPVNKTIEDLSSGITDKSARDHFEAIAEAHPDFAEIADGQELKDYLASLPEADRAKAQNTIDKGSARQIVKLLDNVKAFAASQKQADEQPADAETVAAMDAAEGVRSKGLRIPEKPSTSGDSYEDIWNSIPD